MDPLKNYLLLVFLFYCFTPNAIAQSLCDGNLGENIFEAGDFGSGEFNLLFPNPNIAPGYEYTYDVPPIDGSYTVTNSTVDWEGLWATWLRLDDNSTDPNGYMMVVNASHLPGIFFEQTITGLCENTTYEFSADIINLIRNGVSDHKLPNVSFLLDGNEEFTTGDIPQTERWNTYGFTFVTPPGITEMTLTLRNNAPGGIGNDLALDNISFRACGPSAFINTAQNIFLCEDDNQPATITADIDVATVFIQWQLSLDGGATWENIMGESSRVFLHTNFQPGVYQYRYLSASSVDNLDNFKCRILSDVITIEVLPITYEAIDTTCTGATYLLGEQVLTTSGTYTGNLISSRGCDSIVTLFLTVLPDDLNFDLEAIPSLCPGASTGTIEITEIQGGTAPYTYYLNNELATDLNTDLPEGDFTIIVEDQFGCQSEQEIALFNPNVFVIDAGNDVNLDFGELSNFRSLFSNRPITNVSWSPAEFISCSDCERVQFSGAQNVTYVVTAEDEEGCIVQDSINVFVNKEEIGIYIPNAFSPNADGINDYFQVFSSGLTVLQVRSLKVFNRWGGLVYHGRNFPPNIENEGWDGRVDGNFVQDGVYTYIFDLELIDKTLIQEVGSITIIR